MLAPKFFITLTGLFLSLAVASPTGLMDTEVKFTNATGDTNQLNDQCKPSVVWDTFEGRTDGGNSPLISDCLILNSNIARGGRWEVESVIHHSHQLAQYGTCAFRVKSIKPYHDSFFYVGNGDIIDLINTSIERYGQDGRVGATG